MADGGNEDGTLGGAELTTAEFKAAAPDGVEVVGCPPGAVVGGLDCYVIHNCVTYDLERDLFDLGDQPVFKYWHDVGPHVTPDVRDWLAATATPIFCSPLQAAYMGFSAANNGDRVLHVPPPVDLEPFRSAALTASKRTGAVALGPWMNYDKAAHRAVEVAPEVEFYGGGPCAPVGSRQVEYDDVPRILARYRTFVHLPTAIEPFGRTVVEAWASGCRLVVNNLVGAKWWIEEQPESLETAADDFWQLVLR